MLSADALSTFQQLALPLYYILLLISIQKEKKKNLVHFVASAEQECSESDAMLPTTWVKSWDGSCAASGTNKSRSDNNNDVLCQHILFRKGRQQQLCEQLFLSFFLKATFFILAH